VAFTLLTGFEPFAGAASNPSWDAIEVLAGPQVAVARLPVEFGSAGDTMDALLKQHSPSLVIAVGLANGRASVTPERVAINIEDARIADNAGDSPVDRPVIEGAPAAYFSGLPVKAIVGRLREVGIAAELSQTAGSYVCNHVMYRLMHAVATRHPGVQAGFIHVPATPELATEDEPSMALDHACDRARGRGVARTRPRPPRRGRVRALTVDYSSSSVAAYHGG